MSENLRLGNEVLARSLKERSFAKAIEELLFDILHLGHQASI